MDSPEPLGPDSVTWRYFGDRRGMFVGLWLGVLQNMHPQIAAGVEQHSHFLEERWQRALRSFYPVLGVVYDGPRAHDTARQVVGFHRGVVGVGGDGRRYQALDRKPFRWAHATFVMANVIVAEHFGIPLTSREKDQLCREAVQWYRLYGLPTQGMPEDWAGFKAYWDDMCADVLLDSEAARAVLDIVGLDKPPLLEGIPDWLWRAVWFPMSRFLRWTTTGLLPQSVRSTLGLSWTARDAKLLRVLGVLIARTFPAIPSDLRYHPRARAGWRRARGDAPGDAPLVHTPARNLPPESRRTAPTHYSPAPAAPRRPIAP